MIISDKWNFVYIEVPKCGTHTMRKYLPQYYDAEIYGNVHNKNIPVEHKNKRIWAICRNPYIRAVSIFWAGIHCQDIKNIFEKIGIDDNFTRFTEFLAENGNKHINPLFNSVSEFLNEFKCIKIFHLEKLRSELQLFGILGDRLPPIPVLDNNKHRSSGDGGYGKPFKFYGNKEYENINIWADMDFEMYGYKRIIKNKC